IRAAPGRTQSRRRADSDGAGVLGPPPAAPSQLRASAIERTFFYRPSRANGHGAESRSILAPSLRLARAWHGPGTLSEPLPFCLRMRWLRRRVPSYELWESGLAQAPETAHQHACKETAGRGQVFQPRGELQEPANGGTEFVPLEGQFQNTNRPGLQQHAASLRELGQGCSRSLGVQDSWPAHGDFRSEEHTSELQ